MKRNIVQNVVSSWRLLWAIAALTMSLSGPAMADRNTALHLGVSAAGSGALSMLCYGFTARMYREECAAFGFFTMNGLGLITEIMDSQEREAPLDWGDLSANAAGAAFGTGLYMVVTYYYDLENPPKLSLSGPNGSMGVTLMLEY